MALSTFAELKTSVASWLNRTDLTSAITDFVTLAEADIRSDVSVQAMESYTSGTLTGETLAHPSYFISARLLKVNDDVREYRTVAEYTQASEAGSTVKIFTSIGSNFYILNGASGDTYSLMYRAGFTPLSADSDTNWLLANAPSVYLWAACRHGAQYLRDDALRDRFDAWYKEAAAQVNTREKRAAYSGSPLQITTTARE